jgi:hypothetical protein
MHRVVAVALPEVVAFDLPIPAQIFGHASATRSPCARNDPGAAVGAARRRRPGRADRIGLHRGQATTPTAYRRAFRDGTTTAAAFADDGA